MTLDKIADAKESLLKKKVLVARERGMEVKPGEDGSNLGDHILSPELERELRLLSEDQQRFLSVRATAVAVVSCCCYSCVSRAQ